MFKSHMPSIYKIPLPQTKCREAQTLPEMRLTFPFVRERHLYAKDQLTRNVSQRTERLFGMQGALLRFGYRST